MVDLGAADDLSDTFIGYRYGTRRNSRSNGISDARGANKSASAT